METITVSVCPGLTFAEDGDFDSEITHVVMENWRSLSRVLCDRKIHLGLVEVYNTVAKPAWAV